MHIEIYKNTIITMKSVQINVDIYTSYTNTKYITICRNMQNSWTEDLEGGGYYIYWSNFTAFQQLNFVLQSRMKIFLGNILITDKINQILIKH